LPRHAISSSSQQIIQDAWLTMMFLVNLSPITGHRQLPFLPASVFRLPTSSKPPIQHIFIGIAKYLAVNKEIHPVCLHSPVEL
jgi:hypothetical protein